MESVEVVVHGDARDTHGIGHVLDGSTQSERASFVEETNRGLLVFTAHVSKSTSDLAFDTFDESIQGSVKGRESHCDHELSLVLEGDIGWLHLVSFDECAPQCLDQGLQHRHH